MASPPLESIHAGEAAGEKANPAVAGSTPTGWAHSRWLIVLELVLVVLIFLADEQGLIPISKTPFLLLLGWISLRVRGRRWRDLGLSRYRTWLFTLALGLVAGAICETFQLLVTQPLLAGWLGKQPDLDDFRILHHNIPMSLVALGLTWSLAAFGEEMVWRGYLMHRIADLFGRTGFAWGVSTFAASAAFGLAHGYQGLTGVLTESFAGLWLALIYLATRRNLAVPIIAHGIQDTIDVVLLYLGKFPGA